MAMDITGSRNLKDDFATRDRYSTTELIKWWDHSKLRNAKILLCGVGALGNEVAKNLALLGVGDLILIDFDIIEENNLFKTVLFCNDDIGTRKVEAASRAIQRINPDVRVTGLHGNLLCDIPLGLFDDADIVISGLDSIGARKFVNWICLETQTPWINGGLLELSCKTSTFVPGKTACFECGFNKMTYKNLDRRVSCGLLAQKMPEEKISTTPTSASIAGAIMAQEAIKLLHGNYESAGYTYEFLPHLDSMRYELTIKESCRQSCMGEPTRIVKVDDTSVKTINDIISIGEEHLKSSNLEMWTYCTYVRGLYCSHCDIHEAMFTPEPTLHETEKILCKKCGAPRIGDPVYVLSKKDTGELTAISLDESPFPKNHLYRLTDPETFNSIVMKV